MSSKWLYTVLYLTREEKEKNSRWPNQVYMALGDRVDSFGRTILLVSDRDLLHSYQQNSTLL